jgi:hypothetical protein
MLKNVIILTLAVLQNLVLFGQQNTFNDYRVYSVLIKAEITDKTKSVTITDKLKNDTTSIPWVTEAIKSKDPQQLEQLRFLTRDENGNRVNNIDTTTQSLILAFYQNQVGNTVLQDQFYISDIKVFLVDNFPIKKGSEDEWKRFYKKYQGSGGLFEFSNIHYSQDGKEAIFYHSLFRRGLNAHGALTIMENSEGEWKVKYHINFWQA